MSEEWREVDGYPDYLISSLGRVKSLKRNRERILAQARGSHGYFVVTLSQENVKTTCYVHRLVAGAFVGPLPEGQYTRHLDGDQENNRADNLAYGTPEDNKQDSVRHGTHARGERSGMSKLTSDDVTEIRQLYATGQYSYPKLGRMYGVVHATIYNIVQRVTWKDVA